MGELPVYQHKLILMKKISILCMLLAALSASASRTDSLRHKQTLSFAITNAASQTFFDGPNHTPTAVVEHTISNVEYYNDIRSSFLPLYAVHLRMDYGVQINRIFSIETGLGYLLSGNLIQQRTILDGDIYYQHKTFNTYSYTGSITLPVSAVFTKKIGKGAFTCALGSEFNLPVNAFARQTSTIQNNVAEPNTYTHTRLHPNTSGQQAAMGACLKLGYEHKSVNIGPIVDFYNLVQFHDSNTNSPGFHAYQFYAGVDVAINLESHGFWANSRRSGSW